MRRILLNKQFNTYYLHSSFEIDNKNDFEMAQAVVDYDNQVMEYIYSLFKKMRLFKEGNICFTDRYYFFMEDEKPILYSEIKDDRFFIVDDVYHLEKEENDELIQFLDDINLPFEEKFLNIAFNNFELSYFSQTIDISFLSIMNGLEALLHPSERGEIRYKISRYVALLMGNNTKESEEIFKQMKDFYDVRSSIVHSGSAKISKENESLLRNYLRKSIIEMNSIIKNEDALFGENGVITLKRLENYNDRKGKILYMLDTCGFGQKPWNLE